jgi:hypothetical protein
MNCVNTQFKCASQAYTEGALRFVAAKIAQPSWQTNTQFLHQQSQEKGLPETKLALDNYFKLN